MHNTTGRPKLWTPTFVLILAATLCFFITGQGINAGTSVYLDRMGGTSYEAGIGATIFSFAAALTRIVVGHLIDRTGRIKIMVIGCVFFIIGAFGPVISNSMIFFNICRALQGVGFSMTTTASATAADDVLPQERLGEGIGYHGLGQAISMSFGPAVGLVLVMLNPPEALYMGFTMTGILALVLTLGCRYEKHPEILPPSSFYRKRYEAAQVELANPSPLLDADERREEQKIAARPLDEARIEAVEDLQAEAGKPKKTTGAAIKDFFMKVFEPKAVPGMIPMLLLAPAFGFGIFYMGLFGTEMNFANPGMFFTISAIAMIVVRLLSGRFMDTVLPIIIYTATIFCVALGFVLFYFVGIGVFGDANEFVFNLASIPYGMALGVAIPLNQSVAIKNTPPERWGAANGMFMLAYDIGIGVSTPMWGYLNDTAGFTTTFLCIIGCIVVSYAAAWICYPRSAKSRSRAK